MRLNQASDFALRILMMLANEKEPVTVDLVSQRLRLVKSHVMKIVAKLSKAGVLNTIRGRVGGITLAKNPSQIGIGDIVRIIEADFAIVECMQAEQSSCTFAPNCRLRGVMHDAKSAFLNVLDGQTLQSIASPSPRR